MQDGQVYCNRGGWLGRKIVLQYSLLVKNCIAGEGLNGWFCVAIQKNCIVVELQGIALYCNIWRLNKLYCNLGNSMVNSTVNSNYGQYYEQ